MRNIVKFILVILLFSQSALARSAQLRIMPLGNSITRGELPFVNDPSPEVGYRQLLFNLLKDEYIGLNFVGSQQEGNGFDSDHEGHGSFMADQIRDQVLTWLNNNPADVVLLHIGTNDVGTAQSPADIVDEVEEILDNIDQFETVSGTEVVVFVARIIRLVCCNFDGSKTTEYNNQLQAMVNQRIANGDKLVMVDQESALNYPTDVEPDLVHPTQEAYDKMAVVWEQAITSTLADPVITDPGLQIAGVGSSFTYQLEVSGVPTPAISVSNLPTGMIYDDVTQTVSWTPVAGQEGSTSFDVLASNALGDNNLTIDINVGGMVTNLPTSANTSVTTDEDIPYTFAVPDFPYNDIDGDNFAGIRVISLPTDGSLTINGVSAVAANDIIADVTTLVYTPAVDQSGAPYADFTFRVRNDVLEESLLVYQMDINVDPVNDLPLGADESVTTDEDVPYTFQVTDFTFSDGDGANFNGIRVVTLPSEGTLTAGGAVSAGQIIADVTNLVFTPALDATGTPYTTFTFKVRNDDGEQSVANYVMTINVDPVNDLPTGADELVSTDEDVDYNFQVADFTFNDGDGANFNGIRVVTLPSEGTLTAGGAVSAGQIIADVTNLVFSPDQDGNGTPYTTFTFKVRNDDGEESAADYIMTINVDPVNDLPTGANELVTTDEDVDYNFQVADFTFNDADGANFDGIHIVTLPGQGTLTAGGAVSAGQNIADVTNLIFSPDQDASGSPYTTFTFRVRNDDGEQSAADYTMTINVNPVNDLPLGADESVTTDEDVPYTFQISDFTFNDGDGDNFNGIRVVTLPVEGALTAGGAVTANQIITNVTNLVFTPDQDANGTPYTTFTFKVRNDVGEESSANYVMTINVDPVNDLPLGADESITIDEDVPYTFQVSDFTFNDADGANFNGIRVITLPAEGTLATGGSVGAGQIITNVANLNYTPGADGNGSPYTSFTFKVRNDDGEQSSANYTMTINVNPINDPPSFTKGPDQIVDEDAGPQTVNGWATNLDDGDDGTQELIFTVTNNTNPALFATQPVVNPITGTLTYEPAANANGTASITVRVTDNGSNVAPNVNIGNSETFDITVNAINDEPVVTNSNGKTQYLESSQFSFVVIDGSATVQDIDNANLVSGTVAFTGTYIKGEDALSFVPGSTGISGLFNDETGEMQLTGNRPVSDYQTAFQTLLYVNNGGNNPTGGDREITFSVSDGDLTGSDIKIVTVITENSPPGLVNGDIDDVTVDEDAPNFTIQLFNVFDDAEDEDTDLVFAVDNNTNTALFNSTNINPTTGVLTLDFADDAFGTADLTVSATDTENASTSTTFTVTVNAINDQPTTSGIPNVNVDEDAPNTVINLWDHFADIDNADSDLIFTRVSPDVPGLLSNITINNGAGTLTLDYNANAFGIANITIRATDPGGLSVESQFTVNVAPINDAPLIDAIADPAPINEDAGEQVINLTGINAGPNETQTLTIEASTTSTGLLTIAEVEYTSPNNTAILRYTPVPNASGTADIQVCVSDDGPQTAPNVHITCLTFTVEVLPVDDDPTLDPIPDPSTIFVDAGEQCVSLTGISAGPGENQPITVFATSGNTSLIPNTPAITVNYNSPDATGQICYTPLAGQFGTSTITVTVFDGTNTKVENFDVVVSPVNQEPEINQVADIVIDEDSTPDPLTLDGISAGPGESQDLTFEVISDNTDLFDPVGGSISVNYNQGETEAVLLYTPIADASGEANITIRITDAGPGTPPNDNQKDMTFKITVNPINDAPTLNEIPDQGIFDVGEEPPLVNLTGISEGPKENQSLNITFSSDNPSLVDPAKMLVNFDPANDFGSLTYVIEPSLEGEAEITVCVNDDGPGDAPNVNSFCRTFKVTVSGAPDLEITNATLTLNEVSRGQLFNVNSSIRNNGNESVPLTFLNYYLSSDDVFDEGEDQIGLLEIGPINADGIENIWSSDGLRVSETTPAGNYFILVVVDRTNNVPELNEDNNMFAVPIRVNSNRFPEIEFNNAPDLLLADDQFINYRALVTDDELKAEAPVKFFYRGISSDKDFTERDASEIEQSLFQFTINRDEFLQDPIGLEYYFRVEDIGGLITQTEVSYTYEQYADPGLILENLRYGSGSGDYQMVSVPLVLDNNSPDDVFVDDFGTYNKELWRLFRTQDGGNLENGAGLGNIEPGNGYWLIVKDEPVDPVDSGPGVTTPVTKQEPFVIQLKQGWNQIGSPYNFNVSWSDVIAFNDDPEGVKTVLREYEPNGYVESDILRAFGGAFVESDVDIDIKIPVVRNNSLQTGRTTTNNGSVANQQGDWEVKVDVLSARFNSRINGFGMKNGASYGNDRYDASSSPGLDFVNNIELKFDHAEAHKSFTKDIRPVASSEVWEFTLDTEASSGYATMQWGGIGDQIGDKELYLYDIGNGKVINMRTTSTYEVDLSSSGVFKAYYGTQEFIEDNLQPESIHLGQSYPNPFTNATRIPFTLAKRSSDYQLELSIFNLMGQKVKALASGDFDPGFYELEWNGKNEKGDKQPSGVYLYKLIVKSPNGADESFYGRAILR